MRKLIFILFVCSLINGQNYFFFGEIGDFVSPVSIAADQSGNLIVSDLHTNKITKIDTLGNVQKTWGGYGWDDSGFDFPADICINALKIFVTDKNNHSVKIFDKDLNFIGSLSGAKQSDNMAVFSYPASCCVSDLGDLFVIDSEENRILKFNFMHVYQSSIGGYDAGIYQLSKPASVALNSRSELFAADGNNIVCFDNFGNGITIIEMNKPVKKIRNYRDFIFFISDNNVYFFNSAEHSYSIKKISFKGFDKIDDLIDLAVIKNKIYILTQEQILIFERVN